MLHERSTVNLALILTPSPRIIKSGALNISIQHKNENEKNLSFTANAIILPTQE